MIVGDQTVTPHQVCLRLSVLFFFGSKVHVLCTIHAGKCTSPMDLIGYDDMMITIHYTILHCIILYYIILYYSILYYIVWYCIVLYYILLYMCIFILCIQIKCFSHNHNDYVGLAQLKLHSCFMYWEYFRNNLMSFRIHGKHLRSSRDVRERASWSGWARTKALRKDTPGDLQVGDAVLKP